MNSKKSENEIFEIGDKVEILIDYYPLYDGIKLIEKRYFGTIDRKLNDGVYHIKEADRWFLSRDITKIK